LDVLLLCSNPALAHWLEGKVQQEPGELRPHLQVRDIGALSAEVVALAGTLRESPPDTEKHAELAALLGRSSRALEKRGDRMPYDAILVDEAQDFDRPLWEHIPHLLRDRTDGLLYLFYDEAQRDEAGGWRVPLPGNSALLPLVVNLRN